MKYSAQFVRVLRNVLPMYELRYLPLFWDDLSVAVAYIADVLHAPKAAERLLDSVESAIMEHLENPESALIYKTAVNRADTYYWFGVGNYMIFYVVKGNVMEVRRFLYGARDLTRMLL